MIEKAVEEIGREELVECEWIAEDERHNMSNENKSLWQNILLFNIGSTSKLGKHVSRIIQGVSKKVPSNEAALLLLNVRYHSLPPAI